MSHTFCRLFYQYSKSCSAIQHILLSTSSRRKDKPASIPVLRAEDGTNVIYTWTGHLRVMYDYSRTHDNVQTFTPLRATHGVNTQQALLLYQLSCSLA